MKNNNNNNDINANKVTTNIRPDFKNTIHTDFHMVIRHERMLLKKMEDKE